MSETAKCGHVDCGRVQSAPHHEKHAMGGGVMGYCGGPGCHPFTPPANSPEPDSSPAEVETERRQPERGMRCEAMVNGAQCLWAWDHFGEHEP